MKKSQRHAAILDLIRRQPVRTQEELLTLLEAQGFETTQATVSRDIKDLKIVKASDGAGGYRYSASFSVGDSEFAQKLNTIFLEAVYSVDHAGNICVIKTYASMGPAAGAALDSMQLNGAVGSLAGDDTVLLITRTPEDAQRIYGQLSALLR